jgi:hypothetical protein
VRRDRPISWVTACTLAAFFLSTPAYLPSGAYAAAKAEGKDTSRSGIADPHELLCQAQERYTREVQDYEVYFYRQENLKASAHGGKSKDLRNEEETLLRLRQAPFSIYMEWVGNEHKGRKLVYVQGWNKNRMRVKLTGLAGLILNSIDLAPDSIFVRDQSRHPVTSVGIEYLMKKTIKQFDLAKENDVPEAEFLGTEEVGDRTAYKFLKILPDDPEYHCHRLTIWLDAETYYPLRVETANWQGVVMERYRYEGFSFNKGLTDEDFALK